MNDTTFKQKYETPTAVAVEMKVTAGLLSDSNTTKDQYDPVSW